MAELFGEKNDRREAVCNWREIVARDISTVENVFQRGSLIVGLGDAAKRASPNRGKALFHIVTNEKKTPLTPSYDHRGQVDFFTIGKLSKQVLHGFPKRSTKVYPAEMLPIDVEVHLGSFLMIQWVANPRFHQEDQWEDPTMTTLPDQRSRIRSDLILPHKM